MLKAAVSVTIGGLAAMEVSLPTMQKYAKFLPDGCIGWSLS
jgi:hypothetical protein